MKSSKLVFVLFLVLTASQIAFAQITAAPPKPPIPVANPTPNISEIVSKNLGQIAGKTPVSRERREQAYIKLLEAQRYIWSINPPRSQASLASGVRLAKQSLQKAIELDPTLAEAYTALAELVSREQPNGLEEAILLADIAVKISADNFGGHRILARLYTIKSRLDRETLEPIFTQKAISEWREIARLDPRNAEAFAFLSEFYARTKKPVERIDALRKWQAAAAPLDSRFYRVVMGGQSDLAPENATVKFGQALLETGETGEAVAVLSRAVADNPENLEAIELLSRAVESADAATAATAVQFLQQAVFANPENATLIEILARLQLRIGKRQEALQSVRSLRARNPENYSLLRVEASILNEDGKVDEAVALVKSLIGKKPGSVATANNENDDVTNVESLIFDDFSNHLFIADLYRQAKRGKESVEAVNQAMAVAQTAERREIAKLTLATVQQSAGDFRGAEETLRGILTNTPRNPIALNNLGYFLAERGEKLDEALKLIELALVIEPNNPSYLDSLGWTYFKLGKFSEAEKYLKNALKFDDSSSTVHEHLGDVHQKQGKLELAQTAWQKALERAAETDEKERLKIKLNQKNSK